MSNANLIRAKVSHRTVIRRLSLDPKTQLDTFIRQLRHVYPAAKTPLRLTYLDKDGLSVPISSKEEWKEVIQMLVSGALPLLRLTIHDDSLPNDTQPASETYNLNSVYAEFGSLPALSQFFTTVGSVMKQALEQPDRREAFSAFRSISMAATEAALALKERSEMPDERPFTADTRSSQPALALESVSGQSVATAPSSSPPASVAAQTIEGAEEARRHRPRRTRRRPRH